VLFSRNRKAINLRTAAGAFGIQLAIGALVLYVPFGKRALQVASEGVGRVIGYGNEGISFLFGGLNDGKMFELFGSGGFIFAIRVLPVIVFFSALISVLYHIGAMQAIIGVLGGGMRRLLGTSRTESLSATANIFVGQTEAPLVVRPYIAGMTRSELFAVMVGGLASVAGSAVAGYAAIGVPLEYLIAASFMAAPGGLLFAKLLLPEVERPQDDPALGHAAPEDRPANVIDAAATGASAGLHLALNVGAMLIAFIALIAMVNAGVGSIAGLFGHGDLNLQTLFGYLFWPISWLMGIEPADCQQAGQLLGTKTVVNEFVAYLDLSSILQTNPDLITDRTKIIVTYALCGFANFSSIAIQIGGIAGLAPERRGDLARLGLKAMVGGSIATFVCAAIAGLLI
jgi:CNT family concentrative nucleoside transporter